MEVGVGCMRYFGIRSYLDNFYDRREHYEQQGYAQHKHLIPSRRPKFSSRWWKLILWLGSILVICGFFLILIGLILPHKKVDVDDASPNPSRVILVDQQAVDYNTHLKTSHLIGISLVVFGGILFTLSLLIPTFCHMWCEGDDANDEADPLKLRMEASQSEQGLPVGSWTKTIQPNCRPNQSRMTTDGIVPLSAP